MGVNHTDQSHIKTHDYSNPCHDDDDTDASIAHPFVTTHHDQINDHSSIKQEINGLIRTDDPASILITSQATRDYLANNRDSSRLATSNGDGISLKHTADQFVMLDNGTTVWVDIRPPISLCGAVPLIIRILLWTSSSSIS
mgnify:CR=1 FL=1